jgi:hypothetical protein
VRPEVLAPATFPAYNARMDENKPRRRWLSFGTRDLLWAMALLALGLGWWLDRSALHAKYYADVKAVRQLKALGFDVHQTIDWRTGASKDAHKE